jgi:hypothetical protein
MFAKGGMAMHGAKAASASLFRRMTRLMAHDAHLASGITRLRISVRLLQGFVRCRRGAMLVFVIMVYRITRTQLHIT